MCCTVTTGTAGLIGAPCDHPPSKAHLGDDQFLLKPCLTAVRHLQKNTLSIKFEPNSKFLHTDWKGGGNGADFCLWMWSVWTDRRTENWAGTKFYSRTFGWRRNQLRFQLLPFLQHSIMHWNYGGQFSLWKEYGFYRSQTCILATSLCGGRRVLFFWQLSNFPPGSLNQLETVVQGQAIAVVTVTIQPNTFLPVKLCASVLRL